MSLAMIQIPIPVYRERADLWLRDADRAWHAGRIVQAIAAAEEARDGLNGLIAAMRGTVRTASFTKTKVPHVPA